MSKTIHKTVPEFSLERCKRCGICSHFCPAGAITDDPDGKPRLTDPDACTSCRLCEQLCPDFAVEMVPVKRK
jgi:2-oxoglutarate ferredoxin oxidoreductase subunit delta